jgi:plastocyanin
MNSRNWPCVFAVTAVFALAGAVYSAQSQVRKDFEEAFRANDRDAMASIVKENMDRIPAEIEGILEDAYAAEAKDVRDALLIMVEFMATIYKDLSGEIDFFRSVKQRIFEAWLSPPVRSVPQGGVHVVEIPEATAEVKDKFMPDNIIITRGSTVRWVNRDKIMHLFSSMPFIGKGGVFSPEIEPGKSWEYTFNEPGEYYYICFIHIEMIGKITVVEDFEKEADKGIR